MSERSIFVAALEKGDPAERAAYLDQACAGDAALRQRLERLLLAHQPADSFLEAPAAELAVTAAAPPLTEGPGTHIGAYKLLQQIGEGGMGTVFMAEQTQPVQRRVALKIIKPGMDSRQVIARFEAERQAVALMDHPNIAKVFDAGTTEAGRPYFVMELVHGLPITKYCDDNHLTPKERLELFIPVCAAVQHAHQKGIIHRDLKPSNVLVCLYDGVPVPKVIDFGVAKATSQPLTERTMFTQFGTLVGTLEYMSPEQAEMSQLGIDTRSDVYSLGVLLYELLTGSTPLNRQRLKDAAFDELLRLIREEEPPKPSTRLSDSGAALAGISAHRKTEPGRLTKLVRGELDWIVMKALEKDRARRYETANGLARDVQRYLANESVEACPPSAAYRLRKLVRRHQGPALAAGLLLLALVAGVIGTTIGLVRANRALALAEVKEQEARAAAEAEATAKQDALDQKAQAEANEKRAGAAERQAKDEAAIALAVRRFLQTDLLSQADLLVQAEALRQAGGGFETKENPSIQELLDRAAAELAPGKIEAKFPRQPLVQAEILKTVGDAYRGIGEYGKAVAHLTRAADLYRTTLGPDHLDTLATLHLLAQAHVPAGKPADFIALFETVRDGRVAQLGPSHPDTLTSQTYLGIAYLIAGRSADGIALLERVRDTATKQLGPDDLQTLIAMFSLGIAYTRAGRPADGIALLEIVRDVAERKLPPDHPYAQDALSGLAMAYQTAGRTIEAIPLLEKVRDAQVAKLGPNHRRTRITLSALAEAYRVAGQTADYIASLENLRHANEAKLGPDHQDTLVVLNELATAYRGAGKLDQALPLFQQAADRAVKKGGLADPAARKYLRDLGDCYERLSQFDKAEPLQRELAAFTRDKAVANQNEYSRDLSNLGLTLLRQKKFPEAERTLRECLALREKNQPNLWVRYNTLSQLGGSLLGQLKYADAEPLLLTGYQGMKEREVQVGRYDQVRLSEAADRLVELYTALGKQEEAAKWRAERKKYPGGPEYGEGPAERRGAPPLPK
jgi:serine/threonine protein kinase